MDGRWQRNGSPKLCPAVSLSGGFNGGRMLKFSSIITLVVFSGCTFAASVNDEARSIARQGSSAAESGISALSAEEKLGVSASGHLSNGGRNAHVDYSQVLSGDFACPDTPGAAGRYSKLQQFVTACETTTATEKLFWICVPHDVNDSMATSCEDGSWHSAPLTLGAGSWTEVLAGLEAQIEGCSADGVCSYKVKRSSDFSGGEEQATSQGQSTLSGSSGTTETIQGQGVYLPDGTVLQSGANENSGTLAGEMVAAGTVAACADDVKAAINDGTPVFTCDGQKEVDTYSESGDQCVDEEVCLEEETETTLSSKTCTVSVDFDQASCHIDVPIKECQLSNTLESYTCSIEHSVDHIASFPRVSIASKEYNIISPKNSNGSYKNIHTWQIPDGFRTSNVTIRVYAVRESCNMWGSCSYEKHSPRDYKRNLSSYSNFTLRDRAGYGFFDTVDLYIGTSGNKLANRVFTRNTPYGAGILVFRRSTDGLLQDGVYFAEDNKYIYQAYNSSGGPIIALKQEYKDMGYTLTGPGWIGEYNIINEQTVDTCKEYRDAQ